jgi:hypothetical protein
LLIQERAAERAREAKLVRSGPAARPFSSTAAFAVLVRLRQACIHSSLLPADLLPVTDSSPTHDEEDAIEKTAVPYAEGLKRIQAKRVQSTKLKRVLRVVKVTVVHIFADTI